MTGSELLDRIEQTLDKYVIFSSDADRFTCALWVAATHFQPALEFATRLTVKSPHKRCGKSRLLDVMGELVHKPLITVNISVAALVHSIDETDPPTLMVDEADRLFTKTKGGDGHEDLVGIINSGFQRNRPYRRWNVTMRAMETLPSFGMVVTAGIGDRPDTIEDRGPIIEMRRRAATERRPSPYRIRRDRPPLETLRTELHEWSRANLASLAKILEGLSEGDGKMPVEDRDADKWEALVAVADLAGRHWPERARSACKEMCAVTDVGEDAGGELLRDLHRLFAEHEAVPTAWLVAWLNSIEESPWSTYERRGLNANDLAKLLKPYGVNSTTIRFTDGQKKGYRRANLEDAWSRYCRECR